MSQHLQFICSTDRKIKLTRSDGETIVRSNCVRKVQCFEEFDTITNGDISWPNVITVFP